MALSIAKTVSEPRFTLDLDRVAWRHGLPLLAGTTVRAREVVVADAAALAAVIALRDEGDERPTLLALAESIVTAQRQRESGRALWFALTARSERQPLGFIRAMPFESGFTGAEWSLDFTDEAFESGFAIEAARIVADFLFRTVGVHRLEARVNVDRDRDMTAILTELGASPEVMLRKAGGRRDEPNDLVSMVLVDRDWIREHPLPDYRARAGICAPEHLAEPSRRTGDEPSWRRGLPVLKGHGVTLRELSSEDASSLVELLGHPDVARFITPPPHTVTEFERFVRLTQQQREAGTALCFGIVPEGRPSAVGFIQVRRRDPEFRIAEWGFAIGRPFWGTGVFARSAQLAQQFIFGALGVQRLEARAALVNGRANAALRRQGAIAEGCLRQAVDVDGHYVDAVLWSLTDDDWWRQPPI
jgi:ribosomal-protein-alanine N-acetyltransferase